MSEKSLSPTGRFDRLLLASDGSEFSKGAEDVAIAMAQKGDAALFAFSMVMSNPEFAALAPQLLEKAAKEAAQRLEQIKAKATVAGITCGNVIRYGDSPDKEIVAAAREINADAIVMGRRGRRGLARMMVGDATAKVIGSASCSVFVVPKAAEMWEKRILLATDGSRSSDAAAMAALAIARCCELPISVVSAQVPSHSAERQAEAERIVARVVDFYKKEGIEAQGLTSKGEPDDVIIKTAAEVGADLIIMGSHGRTGWGKVLLGSNSERVIGKACCPVLVAKG